MARRVGMLMPQAGSAYDAVAAEHLGPYRAGFADAGITLVPRPWDMRPDEGDVALALFAWGYHFDVARWDALLATWRPRASRSCRADAVSVAAALDAFGCDERVVKAQISAGSDQTGRVRRG